MALFPFLSPAKRLLSEHESAQLAALVKEAEKKSSGEIRIYIESHCPSINPMQRAQFIFEQLRIHQTEQRNGVLIYIAFADHDVAILGDKGIYNVTPQSFWTETAKNLLRHFYAKAHFTGLQQCITQIGQLLATHFPPGNTHRNELPDEIVFGR